MTQRKNNRYYNINELIKDVEALGDWRDPSQLEAFSEVYYKMTNTGHACSSQKGMHYYPIDVFNAMHDVSSKKFPKQDGDLEIEATIFYGNIHDLAIKTMELYQSIIYHHCHLTRQSSTNFQPLAKSIWQVTPQPLKKSFLTSNKV